MDSFEQLPLGSADLVECRAGSSCDIHTEPDQGITASFPFLRGEGCHIGCNSPQSLAEEFLGGSPVKPRHQALVSWSVLCHPVRSRQREHALSFSMADPAIHPGHFDQWHKMKQHYGGRAESEPFESFQDAEVNDVCDLDHSQMLLIQVSGPAQFVD
jgi:hypothetical protein